jgi:RimJ/RimL family protein N-acetyltransferase
LHPWPQELSPAANSISIVRAESDSRGDESVSDRNGGVLYGRRIALRARVEGDVEILHRELLEDVETRSRASGAAWKPIPLEKSPYRSVEDRPEVTEFSVVDRESDELLGMAILWGIDVHNRHAHIGLSLRPRFWRRGYGTDVLDTLCRYAFQTLGLHRLQLETLIDNDGMIGAAKKAGFLHEGTAREHAWVSGRFLDDVTFGILADEWHPLGEPVES